MTNSTISCTSPRSTCLMGPTNKANTDPGTTADSAVRPPTNRIRVSATLPVAEGSYGAMRLGWGSCQESNTCNTTMSNSPPQTGLTKIKPYPLQQRSFNQPHLSKSAHAQRCDEYSLNIKNWQRVRNFARGRRPETINFVTMALD